MKLTENTKVRIKVPKHLYEAVQAELAKKHEMEEMAISPDGHDKIEEFYGLDPKLDIFTLLLGAGIPIAAAVASVIQQVGVKGAIDLLKKSKIKPEDKEEAQAAISSSDKGKEAPVAEPVAEEAEVEEALDLESLMEAVKDQAKKKAEEKKKKAEADKKKKEAEAKKKADAKKKK